MRVATDPVLRPFLNIGALALLVLAAPGFLDAQERDRARRRGPAARGRASDSARGRLSAVARRGGEKAQVGAPAPEFALPRLEDVEAGSEGGEIADPAALEKVRLSSFRGKRPVVLIFGSYT